MRDEQPADGCDVLALEAWMGGSHAQFLEQWRALSAHRVHVEGLAPRHWKWRMSASAWELGRRACGLAARPDVVWASDYVDLAQLAAFLPADWAGLPRMLYMHENQLTYPERTDGTVAGARDTSWGFKNVLSCLAADRVVFNSAFHRDDFARAADDLLAALPRPNPRAELARALEDAVVVAPGIAWGEIPLGPGSAPGTPLRVLFNHRWEHDKDPAQFLRAVAEARAAGAELELVLLGQEFGELEAECAPLLEELADRTAWRGFAPDRAGYLERLAGCDVVVSTARHEFYGIAVLEAVAAGCTPLLPDRLAYPELLAAHLHDECLYRDPADLVALLVHLAADPRPLRSAERRAQLRASVRSQDVVRTAAELDRAVGELTRPG